MMGGLTPSPLGNSSNSHSVKSHLPCENSLVRVVLAIKPVTRVGCLSPISLRCLRYHRCLPSPTDPSSCRPLRSSVCPTPHPLWERSHRRTLHSVSHLCPLLPARTFRVKKLKETFAFIQQLDRNMSNLRTWLARIESELSKPVVYAVCDDQEIQKRLAEQQVGREGLALARGRAGLSVCRPTLCQLSQTGQGWKLLSLRYPRPFQLPELSQSLGPRPLPLSS